MANIQVRNADGDIVYLKANGTGTDQDPFVPIQDVNIQDQTTPPLNVPFHRILRTTTFAVAGVRNERTFTVTDPTDFAPELLVSFFNVAENRYMNALITQVNGSVITIGTPLDFDYLIGDTITLGDENLAVDGSVTPVVYSIRTGDPGLGITGDITRLIFSMETATTPLWTDFGDIDGGIGMGLVLRRTDGTTTNIFNVKSNSDIAGICYDLDILSGQGLDGIRARLTFAGADKMGVALRISPNEDLEIIVQDNLSSLGHFHIHAQGHIASEVELS